MRYRRRLSAGHHQITSEPPSASPIETDNDGIFEPDSSETDLTEPERASPARQKITSKKSSPSLKVKSLHAAPSDVERVRPARYQVPDDDTDEDLAQIPEDYGRSNQTKKLKLRLKQRWAW